MCNISESGSVIKIPYKSNSPGPDGLTDELCQVFEEELRLILPIEEERTLNLRGLLDSGAKPGTYLQKSKDSFPLRQQCKALEHIKASPAQLDSAGSA